VTEGAASKVGLRFGTAALATESAMKEDSTEKLPLDRWHRARGARMVSFAGYAMPIQYEGIVAEHLWTRESAGLFDVSHMGQLLISGDGVDEALEKLIPADVKGLTLGQQKYSLLLADSGGILDDLMLSRWPGGIYMVVNGAVKYDDIAHLREHLADEITLNHLEDRALLALQGPKAFDVLRRHATGGVDAWISRSGYTGEDGFEISMASDAAEHIADVLCAESAVKPIGLGARDSLRLEADLPLYGHDLDPDTTPIMAALNFAVGSRRRREEANFPGARRILNEREKGATTRRVGLSLEGRLPAREGAEIYAGDLLVGKITSGGFSPTLQAPIAMGYVETPYSVVGTPLEIDVRGKRLKAIVTKMPFVPHRYHRKGAA
jgi:aminomethyltransferase